MTPARSQQIDAFLQAAGWPDARREALAGDASFRRYERIFVQARQAILMDAPPGKEDVAPFVRIGGHLLSQGLSAPVCLARDMKNGLLLLEDLGDDLFSRYLKRFPGEEEALYLAAADVLVALYGQSASIDDAHLQAYDESLMLKEVRLFAEWFLPAVMGKAEAATAGKEFMAIWQAILHELPALAPVLVLRDYHADNLLWLPAREGPRRVGLLDFQDGALGSPAYDVVSFLEDARRDVSPETVEQVLAHYCAQTGILERDFKRAYALLGAQRNCKIIGIFARLFLRDGKRQYLDYLPRVWGHLHRDLAHPLLAPLARWMEANIKPEWQTAEALADAGRQGAA